MTIYVSTLCQRLVTFLGKCVYLFFPALSIMVRPSASIVLGLSVLLFPIAIIAGAEKIKLSRLEKWIVLIFLINVFVMLGIFLLQGYNYQGWKELGRVGRLVLLFPIVYFFIKAKVSTQWFWMGVCLASGAVGVVAIYEVGFLGHDRTSMLTNPILFGDFSLVYACLSLIVAFSISMQRDKSIIFAFLATLASILGLIAVIGSGTKGAWLAAPFGVGIVVLVFQRNLRKTVSIIAILVCMLCAGIVTGIYGTAIKNRLTLMNDDVHEFVSGNVTGSAGSRLEMWRASFDAWKESPILGLGQGRYLPHVEKGIESGRYSEIIGSYSHSHSDYFFTLASSGLMGVFSLLALYGVLILHAYKERNKTTAEGFHSDKNTPAIALMVLTICFVFFSMTEAILFRSQAVSIFVILVGLLVSAIKYEKNNSVSPPRKVM